jgi:mannosyltransferase OCH1-like enzyme
MIPKVVYQSWHTRTFHPIVQEKLDAMRALNPEYEFKIFTDEEMDAFVNEHYPGEIADCYNRLNIIVAKVDFWRYLILHKYGGIYLDIDSDIKIPFREWIKEVDSAIVSAEQNEYKFLQWCLMFSKEHPILQVTIQTVVENISKNLFPNDICKMTGPCPFTKGVLYTHYALFNEVLDHHRITHKTDITYKKDDVSYRVLGIDYSPYLDFKYEECFFLYIDKNHWHYEQSEKDLLKKIE